MENKREIPVIKNENYSLKIEDLSIDGDGIGKIDGYTLFIAGALPGDFIEAKVLKTKKNYGYAKIDKIIEPSKDRCIPLCAKSHSCGGCQLQHLSYNAQLDFKRSKVEETLKRIGGFEEVKVNRTIGMDNPYHYRNKAQYPVRDVEGTLQIGFYASRTHRIIPLETCVIQNTVNDRILEAVKEYMKANDVSAYNEEHHKGLIRHIVIRNTKDYKSMNITLVINGNGVVNEADLIERLSLVGAVEGICLNINRDKTNVILGEHTKVIYGSLYLVDHIGKVSYRISPNSFYQVNPVQTEKLYKKTLEYAGLTGEEIVWDAYCGIGTISLFLAQNAKKVYGVEIVPEAIEDANYNKELNHIENVEFFVGKAEEVIEQKYNEGIVADVIVVDPPRKGCELSLLETMIKMNPERIVYVSCDPATLARDLKVLAQGGYSLELVQPIDMFPMTVHVETVVKLLLVR